MLIGPFAAMGVNRYKHEGRLLSKRRMARGPALIGFLNHKLGRGEGSKGTVMLTDPKPNS
jgi:hypothetical protein